jgi:mRNA-degrading endonuclease RelE of RelBE toxin-antitoxin system
MSKFHLRFTPDAEESLKDLMENRSKQNIAKAVFKSLKLMRVNLRHPSLNAHKYDNLRGEDGEEVFESYAQNRTPGAYRIFWHYGPGKDIITIIGIEPHP